MDSLTVAVRKPVAIFAIASAFPDVYAGVIDALVIGAAKRKP
ncbi:hypothetical protein MBENS4_1156 [Novosphingobium sp. MBES04]|nr:hypothetical protein MBENS4_1156 [Novosphingobium sp. MBES04]